MRLLELKSCTELNLTKDLIDNIPPYAILSHTWGADHDELTFDDLNKGLGKSKTGYTKINFCAQQARKDGLEYIWVDTCCINKGSHTELSEAINSMFRWYYNAEKELPIRFLLDYLFNSCSTTYSILARLPI